VVLMKDGGQLGRSCEKSSSIVQNRREKSLLTTVKRRKANLIGHTLQRYCLLRHVIEGNIEGSMDGKTRKKT